jgi:hypothetical protein
MKHFLSIVLTLSSLVLISRSCIASPADTPQTMWANTYICDSKGTLTIHLKDLQVVLNLLYFSFDRSRCTLQASDKGAPALLEPWHAFQNIIQLRRNPSKEAPYFINKNTYNDTLNLLYELQIEHNRTSKTYATVVESIIQGSLITNKHLKHGITDIRDEARRVIAQAVTNVQEYLNAILHMRNKQSDTQEESPMAIPSLNKNFNLGDFIWALLPHMALDSFVKADEMTISLSEDWWQALYELILLSNMVWKPIERARAELYLEYYKIVYHIAQNNSVDMTTMKVMFNEYGLLGADQQHEQLPDPDILYIPA